MKLCQRLRITFCLLVVTTVICGCSPLPYTIFARNTTLDTVELLFIAKMPDTSSFTLAYGFPDFPSADSLKVYSINEVLPIEKNAILKLTDSLMAYHDSGHVRLQIPPKTTVYLNTIASAFYRFSDKSVVVKQRTRVDTFSAAYPYRALRKLKNVKSKSDGIRFYKTALWYDIK